MCRGLSGRCYVRSAFGKVTGPFCAKQTSKVTCWSNASTATVAARCYECFTRPGRATYRRENAECRPSEASDSVQLYCTAPVRPSHSNPRSPKKTKNKKHADIGRFYRTESTLKQPYLSPRTLLFKRPQCLKSQTPVLSLPREVRKVVLRHNFGKNWRR